MSGNHEELSRAWLFRCVENGVPLHDYQQITGQIKEWSTWCSTWAAAGDERCAQADAAERDGATLSAAQLRLVAALEYHFGKCVFFEDPQQMRAVHRKAVQAYRAALPHLPWPGRPFEVRLDGATFPGVIRLPDGSGGPYPAVMVIPGLDAAKEEMHRLQEVFLQRGMATVTFDGPGTGESEYDHPLRPDWDVVGSAGIDAMQAHPDIDSDRIAVVGVSLGGYYAARTASADARLKAAVSMGGGYNEGEAWDHLSELGQEAIRHRSNLATLEEARQAALKFDVGGVPANGKVPFLVVHGGRDGMYDMHQVQRMVDHFGDQGQLMLEPLGNHVLHNLAYRVRPAVADWVAARIVRE